MTKYGRVDYLKNNFSEWSLIFPGHRKALTAMNQGSTLNIYLEKSMTYRQAMSKLWGSDVTGTHLMAMTFLQLLLKPQDPRVLFTTGELTSLEEALNFEGPKIFPLGSGIS